MSQAVKEKPKKSRLRRIILWTVLVIVVLLLTALYLVGAFFYMAYKNGKAGVEGPATPYIETISGQGQGSLTVTIMGDSLAIGAGASSPQQTFPYQVIRDKLLAKYATVQYNNRAVSGYRVRDMVNHSIDTVVKDQPNLVMISIGTNDVTALTDSDQYTADLKNILDRLVNETPARILLLGIPAVKTAPLLVFPYPQFLDWHTNRLMGVEDTLLKSYPADRLSFIELYNSVGPVFAKNQPNLFAADGYHPNDAGYTVWAKEVEKVLS